jgi:hypothetical protein
MQVLEVRNVHEALPKGIDLLDETGVRLEGSRNGVVYEAPTPVTTVYSEPTERVLFWEERNANPFFHFMEGLWMLDGRNDLAFVKNYAKNMENYSDDGVTLWGAYGWRWFEYFERDQIKLAIRQLIADTETRRVVVQMWDPKEDLGRKGKDVPCNTTIYFKIREGKLNMTVCNRSNDIIWGAYGANVVHMSMLQEYVASMVGIPVGIYYQVSDSFHAYEEIFDDLLNKFIENDILDFYVQRSIHKRNPYTTGEVQPFPMVNGNPDYWRSDLKLFLDRKPFGKCLNKDVFFTEVAIPIQDAWADFKERDYLCVEHAIERLKECRATDWRKACTEWLERKL